MSHDDRCVRILYIAGTGRSGSTLLERMLGQVEGISAVGELANLWNREPLSDLCGCGRVFADCPYWKGVFQDAFGGITEADFQANRTLQNKVDRIRFIARLSAGDAIAPSSYMTDLESYMGRMMSLYRALHQQDPNGIILDSSKHFSWLYLLRQKTKFDLSVVHLVRDSRGVAYSWSKPTKRKVEKQGGTHYLRQVPAYRVAANWVGEQFLIESMRAGLERYVLLRYEDLIADPRSALEKILGLIGWEHPLPHIGADQVDLSRPTHSAAGNPVRFDVGKLQLRLDNEWQTRLSARSRRLVTLLTLPYLLKYRYLPA